MANTNETDASGDEIFSYTVNGKEVDQKEYEKQLAEFNAKYAPFVVIDAEGLNVMAFAGLFPARGYVILLTVSK